ncbi:pyruvate, water dikinase regulatory protein [Hyphobacterium sp. HN65]|uniref:Putative pyruvate, phosphate dikinase regulatory protein n=1 Tax=Hyphobacterium lacteum TaxID=3116575 RepID=A0ABU7LRT8_9PROT|nr:pyruvate, water dikinase regulatory protein [Hyphobacterium sp. HN65]MEE2526630.1 pyruvate, water dikinase regulatory protein [Hyphobacterium sp. HN65]
MISSAGKGRKFHVHLVSDSTGETLGEVMRASVAQFDGVEVIEHLYALVRSPRQMERALEEIERAPGVVMYTVVSADMRRRLEDHCQKVGIPAIAILDPIIATLSGYLALPPSSRAGAQHDLDAQYYERIEALNYAIMHDDGQGGNLEGADVVLLGVSRTSKTPTCIYLAHRGVKAANIPLVRGGETPAGVIGLKKPLIIGLTASPERIVQIRRNRLLSLNEDRDTEYVDDVSVKDEIIAAKRMFARHGWPTIDVTRRSVEETAAKILNLVNDRKANGA